MKTCFTLDEIQAVCDRSTRNRVARYYGGAKRMARDRALPIAKIAEAAGVPEAFELIHSLTWDSVNSARAFAVALARMVLPVYQRHRTGDGAIYQALQTAEDYIAGRTTSNALLAAHKLACAARDRTILPHGIHPPEYNAADAAVEASQPFAQPNVLVHRTWIPVFLSLDHARGGSERAVAAGNLLHMNQAVFHQLEDDAEAAGCRELLARYHDRLRDYCFGSLCAAGEDRAATERTLIRLLHDHFPAGETP